jgi:aromatic-L-amino-acid decarboxylase
MVKVRQLSVDEHYSLRGKTLDKCIQEDKRKGLIPFFVRYFLFINHSISFFSYSLK